MAVRPIVLYPDRVLLTPTKPVEVFDEALKELVADMAETMFEAPGIGLAANQIGVSQRVCIVDLTAGEQPDQLHVFVNPRITRVNGRQVGEEGCLSFPDVTLDIERAFSLTVEALDLEGKPFTLDAEDLLARAIAHECEHLDGKTFLQNVSALRRELVKNQIRKRIKTGDWVATARNVSQLDVSHNMSECDYTTVWVREVDTWLPLRTTNADAGSGFYSHHGGYVPLPQPHAEQGDEVGEDQRVGAEIRLQWH